MRAFLILLLAVSSHAAVLENISIKGDSLYIKLSENVPFKIAYDRGKAIIWIRLKGTVRGEGVPQSIEGSGVVDEVWIYQTTSTICDVFFFLNRQDIDYKYTVLKKPPGIKVRIKYRKKKVKKAPPKKPKPLAKKAAPPEEKKEEKKPEKKQLPPDLELLENARKLLETRDYESALSYIGTFLKNYPNSKYYPDAYFLLGEIYLTLGKRSLEGKRYSLLAVDTFRNFVNYYPFNPKAKEAYVKLAEAYMQLGFYPEAIGILEYVARTYKGTDVEEYALITKARALFLMKRYLDSLESYRTFISKFPKSNYLPDAYYGLASCYYKLGYYGKALSAFRKAYGRWPRFVNERPEYLFYMGDTYYKLGKYKEARRYFFHIITYSFRSKFAPKAMVKIGDTYVKEGNIKKALEAYSEVLKKFPKTEGELIATLRMADLAVTTRGGFKLVRKGKVTPLGKIFSIVPTRPSKKKVKVEKAFYFEPFLNPIDAYKDLLKKPLKYPLNEIVKLKLGVGYLSFKEYTKALYTFKAFIDEFPFSKFKDIAVEYLLKSLEGDIREAYRLGDYWRVVRDDLEFRKFLFLLNSPDTFGFVGESYLNLGLLLPARDYLVLSASKEKSVKKLFRRMLRIAEVSYMLYDDERALGFASLVAERSDGPESLLARNLMGLSYYRLGRFQDACSAFKSLEDERFSFPLYSLYAYAVSAAALGRYGKAASLLSSLMDRFIIKRGKKVPFYVKEAYLLFPIYQLEEGAGSPLDGFKTFIRLFPNSKDVPFAKMFMAFLSKGRDRLELLKSLSKNGTDPYKGFSEVLLGVAEFKDRVKSLLER